MKVLCPFSEHYRQCMHTYRKRLQPNDQNGRLCSGRVVITPKRLQLECTVAVVACLTSTHKRLPCPVVSLLNYYPERLLT
jgi:hypothetical protein